MTINITKSRSFPYLPLTCHNAQSVYKKFCSKPENQNVVDSVLTGVQHNYLDSVLTGVQHNCLDSVLTGVQHNYLDSVLTGVHHNFFR